MRHSKAAVRGSRAAWDLGQRISIALELRGREEAEAGPQMRTGDSTPSQLSLVHQVSKSSASDRRKAKGRTHQRTD